MGALRTSEDGDEVVGGEAKAVKSDDDRAIDAPGRIIIDSAPIVIPPAPTPVKATALRDAPSSATPPKKAGGAGLVVFVYVLATAALAFAIYERFFMTA